MDGVVGDYMKTRWCEMRQRDEKCASKESYDVQGACHVSTKQPCDALLSREIYRMILVLSCKQDRSDHNKDQDTKEQKKLTLKRVCDDIFWHREAEVSTSFKPQFIIRI